jgi:hypothetical protein
MTPSRVMNSETMSFLMTASLYARRTAAAEIDSHRDDNHRAAGAVESRSLEIPAAVSAARLTRRFHFRQSTVSAGMFLHAARLFFRAARKLELDPSKRGREVRKMWNEGSVVGVDTEALKVNHVMDVGRNWFRMTPMAETKTARIPFSDTTRPQVRIAASLFERPPAAAAGWDKLETAKARGRVTAPWWLLAAAGAALLATGAAVGVAAFRFGPAAAPAPAPVVSAPAPVKPPAPASVVVEPIVAPLPAPVAPIEVVTAAEPAPAAKPAATPARRARSAPAKRGRAIAPARTSAPAPAETVWVDPFAE